MDQNMENLNNIKTSSWHRRGLLAVFILVGISLFFSYYATQRAKDIEQIISYDLKMTVSKNIEMLVTETIVYDFGYNRKRGISRHIPLANNSNPRLNVSVLEVVDDAGMPYIYESAVVEGVLLIKIGEEGNLKNGRHTYKITYRVENGIVAYQNFNEIYWNVTGDQWPAEIKNATASIVILDSIDIVKMDCSTGPRGSTDKNCTNSSTQNSESTNVFFATTKPLMVTEGFTILLDYSSDK